MSKRKARPGDAVANADDAVAKIMATAVVRPKIWVDKLSPGDRKVIVQLRQQWLEGNFPQGITLTDVHRATCREIGITVSREVFARYFKSES